ncbi:MAG: glycoside hydrolase family 43 protein [Ferruginibacter sp.]
MKNNIVKRLAFLILAIILICSNTMAQGDSAYLFAYFKNNGQDGLHLAYSTDGFTYTALNNDKFYLVPQLSKDKLMRDPCIIRGGDNKFHMVWTVSWTDPGIGHATSTDLIHWSDQQYIPVMDKEPTAQNAWAPEIFYDTEKRQYMIYWATTIPGKFPATDTLGDDKNNHRMYYTLTKDFNHFSKTRLLYNQGFNVIDATIQKQGKQYIMFLKDETKKPLPQKNIRIATSKSLIKKYSKPSQPITGKYWAEGPTAIKVNGQWMVYFDKYTEHTYGAVVSDDLINWKDVSDKIHFPLGTRHGTVFKISGEELAGLNNK